MIVHEYKKSKPFPIITYDKTLATKRQSYTANSTPYLGKHFLDIYSDLDVKMWIRHVDVSTAAVMYYKIFRHAIKKPKFEHIKQIF